MNADLTTDTGRKIAAEHIRNGLDQASIELFEQGFRNHLGASILGHDCDMYLWLTFRWAAKDRFRDDEEKARMLRLWQRGHREEPFQASILRKAGWIVNDVDPETGKQIRITFSEGHGGGSLDAEIEHSVLFPGIKFITDFKTYSEKRYKNLTVECSVKKESRTYFTQLCMYGRRRGIKYAVFFPVNKNDDAITNLEVVELDWDLALSAEARADRLIHSKEPPERLALDPTFWKCRNCSMRGPCHEGQPVLKNCRSCRNIEPIADAKFFCRHFNQEIPAEFIANGCDNHFPIQP